MGHITVDLKPMLGRVAVAPANGEAFAGLWPGNFGGNMDAPEVREGTTRPAGAPTRFSRGGEVGGGQAAPPPRAAQRHSASE